MHKKRKKRKNTGKTETDFGFSRGARYLNEVKFIARIQGLSLTISSKEVLFAISDIRTEVLQVVNLFQRISIPDRWVFRIYIESRVLRL